MRWLLALLLVASTAQAQRTEFVPPQSGATDSCTAKAYNPAQLDSCRFIHTIITKDNVRPFAWNNLLLLDNNADSGESTGQYIKANQFGKGATWASVLQIQCVSPVGDQCFAQEIDLQPSPSGDPRGYGIAMFLFRASHDPVPPDSVGHALAAYSVSAGYGEWGHVDVAVGFDAQIHCTVACFRMPIGESFAWELTGSVVTKLDPNTGYWGLWRGNRCVVCWNADTGDEKHNWTP